MSKSRHVQVRFGQVGYNCLREIQDLLFVKSLSDTIRDFTEMSLRLQMEKDLHWPVSYGLLDATIGEQIYSLYCDWLKAKAGHSGYYFRIITEMNESRVLIITPAHTAVKQIDYEQSQRTTLKKSGYDDAEVDEIIETLRTTWGEEVEVPVPATEAAIAAKVAAEAAEAADHTKV